MGYSCASESFLVPISFCFPNVVRPRRFQEMRWIPFFSPLSLFAAVLVNYDSVGPWMPVKFKKQQAFFATYWWEKHNKHIVIHLFVLFFKPDQFQAQGCCSHRWWRQGLRMHKVPGKFLIEGKKNLFLLKYTEITSSLLQRFADSLWFVAPIIREGCIAFQRARLNLECVKTCVHLLSFPKLNFNNRTKL